MEKAFCMGLLFGGVCGAIVVANNYKLRLAVKKGQQEVTDRLDAMLDEKLGIAEKQKSNKEE